MPDLTIEGAETITVPTGTRLLNALIDQGVDMLYRCGGYARCGLCQVAFSAGEPAAMTAVEQRKLGQRNLLGTARLACQIEITQDMAVRPLLTWAESGLSDPGPHPEPVRLTSVEPQVHHQVVNT